MKSTSTNLGVWALRLLTYTIVLAIVIVLGSILVQGLPVISWSS